MVVEMIRSFEKAGWSTVGKIKYLCNGALNRGRQARIVSASGMDPELCER